MNLSVSRARLNGNETFLQHTNEIAQVGSWRQRASWAGVGTLLALSLSACVTPPLDEGLAPEETGVVSGSAVVTVPLASPAPIILVLVSAATDEAGNPLYSNLTVIPVSDLQLDPEQPTGVYSGNFTFPLVPEGVYVLNAVADADGNFDPVQFSMTKQLYSLGDVVGAYAVPSAESPTGYQYVPIQVTAGEISPQVNIFLTTKIEPPPTSDSGG